MDDEKKQDTTEVMPAKKHRTTTNYYCRLLFSGYVTLFIIFSLICSFFLQILCTIIFFPLFLYDKKYRLLYLGRCLKFCTFCVFLACEPFWKVKVIRKCKKGYKPKKTLLIANHLSALDPWVINRCIFPWELKYVYKSSLMKVPFGGQCLLMSGDIPIYFTKEKGGWGVQQGSIKKIMNLCKEYQDLNIGTVVFPEGTRSITGQLQLFKPGFFRFALENNCEILPCALHGSNKLWPVKSMLLDVGTVYFSFGEPFYPSDGMTCDELKEKTRLAILQLLQGFPDYDPEVDKLLNEPVKTREHGI